MISSDPQNNEHANNIKWNWRTRECGLNRVRWTNGQWTNQLTGSANCGRKYRANKDKLVQLSDLFDFKHQSPFGTSAKV